VSPAKHEEPQDLSAEGTLERTASQVAQIVQVRSILDRMGQRKGSVEALDRTVSELGQSTEQAVERSAADSLRLVAMLVERARKQTREFNEDLVDDMLALDRLSGLASQDRARRKSAIACIDALLERLDAASGRLGRLQKRLLTELEVRARHDGSEGKAPKVKSMQQASAAAPGFRWPSPSW